MERPSAFSKLKPLCINLLKDCSIENLENLEKAIHEISPKTIQPLLEYITLPLRAQLSTELRERINIKCINILTVTFQKAEIRVWDFFADIFTLMIFKLTNRRQMNTLADTSEELKLSVCENILCLLQSSTEEVLNEMYSLSFRLNLGHAIYIFNIMLNQERSKSLQKSVLNTIGALTYNEMYVGKKFSMTEDIAREALASFLPGLAIALQKVTCDNIKQAHDVLVGVLNILGDLISRIAGDESYKISTSSELSADVCDYAYKSGKLSKPFDPKIRDTIPAVKKDNAWYTSVSEKLEILVKTLMTLASHTHWRVRLEFVTFSECLLLKCTNTLKNCIPLLLPAIFGLTVDDNHSIVLYSKNLLMIFSEKYNNTNFASHDLIESSIQILASELILSKISSNDSKKLATLKCIQGYLEILGPMLKNLLFSINLVEKIVLALLTLLEFDTSSVNVVEEIPVVDTFEVCHLPWPKKRFKFFENEDILNTVSRICYAIGHIQNSQILIDFLIEKMSSTVSLRLQCIFLIGRILKGFSVERDASEKYLNLVGDVLDLFLSNDLFSSTIHRKENINDKNSVAELAASPVITNNVSNRNILQTSLILEAIAKCAECLNIEFKVHLIRVLCPVMEKAGHSNFMISQSGHLCLHVISQSCQYDSVGQLVKDNADYITNVLLINFHQCMTKPETAVVLKIAIEHCDSEALVLFQDIIFQILTCIDYNQDKAQSLMLILYSVLASIKKWFPSIKNDNLEKCPRQGSKINLKTDIIEYISIKKTATNLDADVSNTEFPEVNDCIESDDSTEAKPIVPIHVNITCEVFQRCIHLQATENAYFRMMVLETVELCIMILRDHEQQLLPLVHEFWYPFLHRFLEETFISKAFNVLLQIADVCGDFIRQRTFKAVVPNLIYFLKKEYPKSRLKCNFRQYRWTNDHSLQVLILSEIGNLCLKLDVDSKDICEVANVCLPYLQKDQPKKLQEAAIKSLKALATLDSDAIWFYWNVLYSEDKVIRPPDTGLPEMLFPFSDNTITAVKLDFL